MKYSLVLFILLWLSCNPQNLLSQPCGTIVTEEQEAFIARHLKQMGTFDGVMTRGIRDFPLKVHIIRNSDGTGGMGLFSLKAAINNWLTMRFITFNFIFL